MRAQKGIEGTLDTLGMDWLYEDRGDVSLPISTSIGIFSYRKRRRDNMSTAEKIDTLKSVLGAVANILGGHFTAEDYRDSIERKGSAHSANNEKIYVNAVDELELASLAYTSGNKKDAEKHVNIAIEKFYEMFSSLDGKLQGFVIEQCEDKSRLNLGKFSDLMEKLGLTTSN